MIIYIRKYVIYYDNMANETMFELIVFDNMYAKHIY